MMTTRAPPGCGRGLRLPALALALVLTLVLGCSIGLARAECDAGYVLDASAPDGCRACEAGKVAFASICANCAAGTFQPLPAQTACLDVAPECTAGQLQAQAPTLTSDRLCANCTAGTTDHDRDPLTPCRACPAGHYAPPASAGPCAGLACPITSWDHDDSAATPCQALEQRVAQPACPLGFAAAAGNASRCQRPAVCRGGDCHCADTATLVGGDCVLDAVWRCEPGFLPLQLQGTLAPNPAMLQCLRNATYPCDPGFELRSGASGSSTAASCQPAQALTAGCLCSANATCSPTNASHPCACTAPSAFGDGFVCLQALDPGSSTSDGGGGGGGAVVIAAAAAAAGALLLFLLIILLVKRRRQHKAHTTTNPVGGHAFCNAHIAIFQY